METSYKEKYEDILARLAKAKNDNEVCDERFCCVINEIIPELAESEDEKIRKWCISHFKACINVIKDNDEYKEYLSNKVLAWLEKQGEQKSAEWSEEDEEVLDALIRRLKGEDIHVSPHLAVECLESPKGRVLPKQEWSEEDEQHIDSLLKRLDDLCRNKFERTRFAISEDRDWLKSLRPQNRWKPSSEQIGLLQAIINEPKNAASESCQIVLREVLEQLKKLKGEV